MLTTDDIDDAVISVLDSSRVDHLIEDTTSLTNERRSVFILGISGGFTDEENPGGDDSPELDNSLTSLGEWAAIAVLPLLIKLVSPFAESIADEQLTFVTVGQEERAHVVLSLLLNEEM